MNSQLLARFESFAKWFARLGPRERWLATAGVILLAGVVFEWMLFKPQRNALDAVRQNIGNINQQIEQTHRIIAQKQLDPGSLARLQQTQERELTMLTERVARADNFLDSRGQTRVSAAALVRRLSRTGRSLTLSAMHVEPASALQPLSAAELTSNSSTKTEAKNTAIPHFYRVGVSLSLKGEYSALISYLDHLERDMKGLIWTATQLDAAKYPEIKLDTVIYTLSTSDNPLSAGAD